MSPLLPGQFHSISPRIVAVAVLYNMSASHSESVSSFFRLLGDMPELASYFSLILYDNSPEPQQVQPDPPLPVTYVHDGTNGGLAPAYNYALQYALKSESAWLLLLDQDTTLTRDYLVEVVERMQALDKSPEIGGIVPKLVAAGTVYSPEASFLYQVRHQIRRVRHPVQPTALGVQDKPLTAYNSGALLRVKALEAIGGFPADFWLDYLDHAVFQEMSSHGFHLYVMQASLEQKLSHMNINEVPHWRHRNVLTAQTRFIVRYGHPLERMFFRLYLLRTCRFLYKRCTNRHVWKEMLLQALLLRVPSVKLGN